MDFLPWTTFSRIVKRYQGDHYVKALSCSQHFRVMGICSTGLPRSLRDIEVCLAAQSSKLYHMGFKQPVRRATLADANAKPRLAHLCRLRPTADHTSTRTLFRHTAGYRLGRKRLTPSIRPPSIFACRSFLGPNFEPPNRPSRFIPLLDLQGHIPSFIHISDGKCHDVNVLDILLIEPGAFYIMDRAYVDFERLQYGFTMLDALLRYSSQAQSLMLGRLYSSPVDRSTASSAIKRLLSTVT